MPDAQPGFTETNADQATPGVGSALAARGGIALAAEALPGFGSATTGEPGFVVAFRSTYLARTGETYVPHFDDINAPTFQPGTTEEDVIAGTTLTQVDPTDGAITVFIGTFEDPTDSTVSLPVPAGTVAAIQVRASVAPGVGKNFTYTLMRNGSAASPAMTVALNGASQSGSTSVNPVSCAIGDRVSLRLVADSGASAAHHRFTLRYTVNT